MYDPLNRDSSDTRSVFFQTRLWRTVQVALAAIALYAAWWHSIKSTTGPDVSTLSFVVLVLVIVIVPLVGNISIGGASVEFLKQQVGADTALVAQGSILAQIGIATAGRSIVEAQHELSLVFNDLTLTKNQKSQLTAARLFETTAAITELLRPPPPPTPSGTIALAIAPAEVVRVSAWIVSKNKKALSYVTGWPIEQVQTLVGLTSPLAPDDPASIAFNKQQMLNFSDIPADQRPPPNKTVFHAICITPIYDRHHPIGVLQIEREKMQRFDSVPQELIRALAAFYGTALAR